MTKIDIFSGFLGAGKTTLIKKLLSCGFNDEKVVLIENEFGEIGIDGGFLKDAGINVTEINSGCICCSLVGDFGKALDKVLKEFSPDRILIEPSGVGKLSDVIKAVNDLENDSIAINSATTVVDAKKCKMYMKNFGEFFNNQIDSAKCIILSHTDNLSEEKLNECINLIKEKNHDAVIISTEWSKLTASQILSAIEGNSIENEIHELEADECPVCHHHHEHHHEHNECHHKHHHGHEHHHEHCSCGHEHHEHHHHHADEVFLSLGFETAKKYSKDEIKKILSAISDEETYGTVLRAKGYVEDANSESWIYFDYIPGTPDVRDGIPNVCGRICVIGKDINNSAIKELFGV